MNGFMIPPGMMGGSSGGNVLTVPSLNPNIQTQPLPGEVLPNISDYQPPAEPAVYSDLGPVYATDTPALIPQTSPQWFDWQAPLDTSGFVFADDPGVAAQVDPFEAWPSPLAEPPSTTQAPVSTPTFFNPQAPLDFSGLVFPETTPMLDSGFASDYPESVSGDLLAGDTGDIMPADFGSQDYFMAQSSDPGPSSGPIEWVFDIAENVAEFAGDVVKTGLDVIWDIGAGILEKLQISISETGFKAASPFYTFNYPADTLISRESEKTYAETTKLVEQGKVTGTTGIGDYSEPGLLSGLADKVANANPILLFGGGVVLLYLYSRR